MKSLLKIVTDCIDNFSKRANVTRFAAIIGGEAVIMHGIPRTTIDLDVLFYCGDEKNSIKLSLRKFGMGHSILLMSIDF